MSILSTEQIADAGLTGWSSGDEGLRARIPTPDFAAGLELVNAIGAVAEQRNHHPDLDLRYGQVGVLLISHDVGGVTARDIRLARAISELAAAAGLHLEA